MPELRKTTSFCSFSNNLCTISGKFDGLKGSKDSKNFFYVKRCFMRNMQNDTNESKCREIQSFPRFTQSL